MAAKEVQHKKAEGKTGDVSASKEDAGAKEGTTPKVPTRATPERSFGKFLVLPLVGVLLSVAASQIWEHQEVIKSTARSYFSSFEAEDATTDFAPISRKIGNYTRSPLSHWNAKGEHYWTKEVPRTIERSGKCKSAPKVVANPIEVTSVFDAPEEHLISKKRVLAMRNGENRGVLLEWDPQEHADCLYELAEAFAAGVRLDLRFLDLGPRLMSGDGFPITSADGIRQSKNMVYVLTDGQHWVWPGIRIGHTFEVDGVQLKTMSLTPKVFHISGFLTPAEADRVREEGTPLLKQSTVVGSDEASTVRKVSTARTSTTAYLSTSNFTRDFQYRSARLLRLPSPGFAESLQYVRYSPGQYYRGHYDYFEHLKILPDHDKVTGNPFERFQDWAQWAQDKVSEYGDMVDPSVRKGGKLYPDPNDFQTFQWNLLQALLASDDNPLDDRWVAWVEENVKNRAVNIIETMVESMGWVTEHLWEAWRKAAGPQFTDTYNPRALMEESHPVAQYVRWIRWAKEKVFRLGDQSPAGSKPEEQLFPSYKRIFMKNLANLMVKYPELWTAEDIPEATMKNMSEQVDQPRFLLRFITEDRRILSVAFKAFEKEMGPEFKYSVPKFVPWIEPNRFATIFMYLSDVSSGGQTVFPRASSKNERILSVSSKELMSECEKGLVVPSTRTTAALFYHKRPDGTLDPLSLHGGCPPAEGETKHGSNNFVWDVDYLEGVDFWGM